MEASSVIKWKFEFKDFKKCCKCIKSECLKFYCNCFKNGQLCEDCLCQNCRNTKELVEKERQRPLPLPLPRASASVSLGAKLYESEIVIYKAKGCNCPRSKCKQNYCKCYKTGALCTEKCSCKDCENKSHELKNGSLHEGNVHEAENTCRDLIRINDDWQNENLQIIPWDVHEVVMEDIRDVDIKDILNDLNWNNSALSPATNESNITVENINMNLTRTMLNSYVKLMIEKANKCKNYGMPDDKIESEVLNVFHKCLKNTTFPNGTNNDK